MVCPISTVTTILLFKEHQEKRTKTNTKLVFNFLSLSVLFPDVPDSCCVVPTVNCGRQASNHGRDRSQIIHTKGCLVPYMDQYTQHTRHLAILSITFAILFFIDATVLLYLYSMLRRMANASQAPTGSAPSANNRRPTVHFESANNRRPTVHFDEARRFVQY